MYKNVEQKLFKSEKALTNICKQYGFKMIVKGIGFNKEISQNLQWRFGKAYRSGKFNWFIPVQINQCYTSQAAKKSVLCALKCT